METIGFIGLGHVGGPLAANIRKAGYPMVVYDIREEATRPLLEAGARLGESPADVSRRSNVIFTSLPGPKEVEQVAVGSKGVLEGIKQGGIYVDLSSSRPALIRRIGTEFGRKRAHVLDAPIIVGKQGAARRSMQLMVSGEQAIYEQVKPILDAFAERVVYTGSLGTGSIIKLAHNLVRRGVALAIGEGIVLGAKAGVDPLVLWECMHWGLDVQLNQLSKTFPQTVFRGDFESGATFPLALARKDVGLATELGREYNVPMPVASLVEQVAIEGMNRGWGDKSTAVLFRVQEDAAGVQVRVPDKGSQKARRSAAARR